MEDKKLDEKQKLINSILLLDTDSIQALFQLINAYGDKMNKLAKQDKLLHIFKNNIDLVDYKGNGSTQAYKIIIEDKFTVEEDGEYVTHRNSDFDDIKEWLDGKTN